jgi:hypothetical protein
VPERERERGDRAHDEGARVPGRSVSGGSGAAPSSRSVPRQVNAPAVDAPRTTAAGVAGDQPRASRRAATAARAARPIRTTTVAEAGARPSRMGP